MSRPWPKVRRGELLRRSEESIKPVADAEYREVTVRLWVKGLVERGRITGADVSGRRFIARTGQFIASRIDAWNGAMGLVPESLDGALVTNDLPLFRLDTDRLEPAFLGWLCRTADFVVDAGLAMQLMAAAPQATLPVTVQVTLRRVVGGRDDPPRNS